ncbi:C2 domain-containing protein [Artemisia annua]|uniref:C2 domain-containing protein n=1 Tax=Artemisia annua TaxID=35608 RepID=A0A2U1M276_ARTAN|nr:C2 domain-containing protein [Artemisia annua]
MERRTLELTIISAGGLTSLSKYNVYVVVGTGTGGKKLQTHVLRSTGSSELTLNIPIKLTFNEAAGLEDRLDLVIKIKAVKWLFFSKTLGKVRVPIKDLMEGITEEGKESQLVSYPVINGKAEPGSASLTFSYKFGKKFWHKVKAPNTSGSKVETDFLAGVLVGE